MTRNIRFNIHLERELRNSEPHIFDRTGLLDSTVQPERSYDGFDWKTVGNPFQAHRCCSFRLYQLDGVLTKRNTICDKLSNQLFFT